MRIVIKISKNKDKKYSAIFYDDNDKKIKTTNFGSAGMNDYTLTGDKEARKRYRERHAKDLDTKDYKRAGYLSYYILWGDSTSLQQNIKDYKKKFNLK
jgi:hypothetical protein